MTTEFPLDLFPAQLFPDANLRQLRLETATLTVTVSDSEWGLAEDKILFYGRGDMVFQYEGAPVLKWKKLHEKSWHESGPEILSHLAALDFICRQADDSWLFQFSSREQGFMAGLFLEKITRIDWTGDANERLLQRRQSPADETPAGDASAGDAPAA